MIKRPARGLGGDPQLCHTILTVILTRRKVSKGWDDFSLLTKVWRTGHFGVAFVIGSAAVDMCRTKRFETVRFGVFAVGKGGTPNDDTVGVLRDTPSGCKKTPFQQTGGEKPIAQRPVTKVLVMQPSAPWFHNSFQVSAASSKAPRPPSPTRGSMVSGLKKQEYLVHAMGLIECGPCTVKCKRSVCALPRCNRSEEYNQEGIAGFQFSHEFALGHVIGCEGIKVVFVLSNKFWIRTEFLFVGIPVQIWPTTWMSSGCEPSSAHGARRILQWNCQGIFWYEQIGVPYGRSGCIGMEHLCLGTKVVGHDRRCH